MHRAIILAAAVFAVSAIAVEDFGSAGLDAACSAAGGAACHRAAVDKNDFDATILFQTKAVELQGKRKRGGNRRGKSRQQESETGGPELIHTSSKTVTSAAAVALADLQEETASCAEVMRVASLNVLSALTEVNQGEVVILDAAVTGSDGNVTYHTLKVYESVHQDGDMASALEGLVDENGEDVAWCEVMSSCTSGMCKHASLLSHAEVLHYHRSLGYLGSYSDAGENPDLLLEVAKQETCEGSDNLPTRYDVRDQHQSCFQTKSVMQQGECGSCWAFAVSAAVSGRACMQAPDKMEIKANGERKQFSTQQIMSCNKKEQGCLGGHMSTAFHEYKKGIVDLSDYDYQYSLTAHPWSADGKHCQWGVYDKPWIVTSTYRVEKGDLSMMMSELFCKGPYGIAFEVYQSFFSFFRNNEEAVYHEAAVGTELAGGHGVTLVGYGVKDGVDYWELLNSWGQGFGNSGFFRMQRGVNLCSIETRGMVAGDVSPQSSWWMYEQWGNCDSDGNKSRTVACKGATSCAKKDGDWPNLEAWGTKGELAEQEPVAKTACGSEDQCTNAHCSGFGTASGTFGSCTCTCEPGFAGDRCEQCEVGWSWLNGFCREECTRADDCNNHGDATGHKWRNEFNALLNNCACSCDTGFSGAKCDARESYHWVVEGREGKIGSPQCVAASIIETVSNGKKIGLSCCSNDPKAKGFREPECLKGYSFAVAQAYCAAKGGRLCTKDEMQKGKTAGTGCRFDRLFNWVSDTCQPA